MENIFLDPKYYDAETAQLVGSTDLTVLESYDESRQREERRLCEKGFDYFCNKYIKIAHPVKGLVPFVLYRFQKDMVAEAERNRFSIVKKFRQGGVSTTFTIWALWRAMFFQERSLFLHKSDREAVAAGEIVRNSLQYMPAWLKPETKTCNAHQIVFDEGVSLSFYTIEAARGRSVNWLFIDEAAFFRDLEKHWKAIFPTINTSGKCVVVSTTNGVGNWFQETYRDAEEGKNNFKVIPLDYRRHPDYDNEEWAKTVRNNLGEKGWRQEVLCEFVASEPVKKAKREPARKIIEIHHYIHMVQD